MNPAIGYIRVSTGDQAENGVSLDVQVEKIKAYCRLHNLDLVAFYGDPGISGKSMNIRPGLQAVMHMVERKRIRHVVVLVLDRLARKTRDCLDMAETMDKKGVSFHSIYDCLDTKSAIGRLFFTIRAGLAQFEREQLAERTQGAMVHMKANGQKVSSQAPYGYRYEGTVAVEDEHEQGCIEELRRIRDEFPSMAYGKIARRLAHAGYLNRNGEVFGHNSIKGLLKTP